MNITAGKYKGQKILVPDEKITRPTLSKVRMSVFNTLQALIEFDKASFLDMFSGSGIMALEALSRGFENVIAIEKHPKAASIIKNNFKKFIDPPLLYVGDSLKIVSGIGKNFDVIYVDPPYYSGIYEQSLEAIKNTSCGIIILEHVTEVNFAGYTLLKQKKYGDKYITFLRIM